MVRSGVGVDEVWPFNAAIRLPVVELGGAEDVGVIAPQISVPKVADELLNAFQSILRECSVMLPRAFLNAAAISAPVAKRFSRSFSSAFMTTMETGSGIASSGLSRCGGTGGVRRC